MEDAGVLVMVNGYVLNDTSRALSAKEFRGFALADSYAPLVFINSADSISGRIFTLAHELGHLLLGKSALGDGSKRPGKDKQAPTEAWCNKFAAELLVPEEELRREKEKSALDSRELERIANYFNVSNQVILLRQLNTGMIGKGKFDPFWKREKAMERKETAGAAKKPSAGGPNYYDVLLSRFGRPFPEALCQSVDEGNTLYRDAMRLLGFRNPDSVTALHQRLQKIK